MSKHRLLGALLVLSLLLAGCTSPILGPTPTAAPPLEYAVSTILLTGPLARSSAEVSGLAWYGDQLILLPQYPAFSGRESAVYALPRRDILAYLDGSRTQPLKPTAIPFVAPGLAARIDGFEGYEAIAFASDRAFLTIEASTSEGMAGYLVSGRIAPDLSELTLDTAKVVEIPSAVEFGNRSDEALIVAGDMLATFYEANGMGVNPSPVAHLFDTHLVPADTIPFPAIEYRVTDATTLDEQQRFWVINYFYPGDRDLRPETDPLAVRYGKGPSHAQYEQVERLVELEYSEAGIEFSDRPPIQLELPSDKARNWEGLVRLDERGFLLVTDKFPRTILGFVPYTGEK